MGVEEPHEEPSLVFKFILVGDSAVGKTAMTKRFCDGEFLGDIPQTIGLEFSHRTVSIRDACIRLQIWDTAGQERFRSVTRSYFRDSAAVFLVYDVTNRETFSHMRVWHDDSTHLSPPGAVPVLIGNKTDLAADRKVSTEEAAEFAKQHSLLFFETSALSGEKIDDAFMATADKVYSHVLAGKVSAANYARPSSGREWPFAVETENNRRLPCC
jgi:small GTP-binding protein